MFHSFFGGVLRTQTTLGPGRPFQFFQVFLAHVCVTSSNVCFVLCSFLFILYHKAEYLTVRVILPLLSPFFTHDLVFSHILFFSFSTVNICFTSMSGQLLTLLR